MKRLEIFEEYFIELYKKFGIVHVAFEENEVNLDDNDLRNMIFTSKNFAEEFEKLRNQCQLLGQHLRRSFTLVMKRDMCNNYFVLVN